jgi:hypothetical protein
MVVDFLLFVEWPKESIVYIQCRNETVQLSVSAKFTEDEEKTDN